MIINYWHLLWMIPVLLALAGAVGFLAFIDYNYWNRPGIGGRDMIDYGWHCRKCDKISYGKKCRYCGEPR